MIYWDSSVILKLYAEEPGSGEWQDMALAQSASLRTSALAYAEMAFALRQKELRGELAAGGARALFKLFQEDLAAGRFLLVPIGRDVLEQASAAALTGGSLRTLDGIHLATAKLAGCLQLATTDRRLAEAAGDAGMQVLGV